MQALSAAIRGGDVATVRRELEADPKLAKKAQHVVDAARFAQRDVLALLFARGADPNAANRGYRPLHALIQEEPHGDREPPSKARLACLALLLEKGADPEQLGAWPASRALITAAFTGIDVFVESLLAAGAVTDGFSASALGDLAGVKRALKADAKFARARDTGGLTALQCAAGSRMGRDDAAKARKLLEIAALLLDAGADANARTKSWSEEVDVAYFAVRDPAMLELVLARGADATAALSSALWTAAVELGPIVLRHGGELDRAVHDGRPLLNDLIRWGQFRPAMWMLEHGASPNLPDGRGWTAVHQAASRGNERLMRAILAAGGDRTRLDGQGLPPWKVAMLARKPKMMELLASR